MAADPADSSGTKRKLAAPAEELPRMLTPKYRLDSLIAVGGMGRVYAATQLPLQRKVAIKLLSAQKGGDDFRRRFLLEASVSGRLTHRNIVTVHDYGETSSGELFMVMELLDGEPLSAVLERETRFSPERACWIAIEICRALRAAHRESVAHRDLKPGNIMLLRGDEEGEAERVKVLDFGLVKVFQDTQEAPLERDLTQSETMLGSPRYMAPEQILCEPVDNRADIYSLGVVLFTMLTGALPFGGKNAVQVLKEHLHAPVPRLADKVVLRHGESSAPEFPAELDAIVQRCMQKSPDDRFQNVDELARALGAAYASLTGARSEGSAVFSLGHEASGPRSAILSSLTPTPTPAFGELRVGEESVVEPRSRGVLVGGALALLLAAIVFGFVLTREGDAPAEEPEMAAPPVPAPTRVSLTSEPPGAEVRLGERLLGVTPTEVELEAATLGERVELEFTLEGHWPATVPAVLGGESVAVHTALRPLPPTPAEPAETEPPTKAVETQPARSETARERRARSSERKGARPAAQHEASAPQPEVPSERRIRVVDESRRRAVPVVD